MDHLGIRERSRQDVHEVGELGSLLDGPNGTDEADPARHGECPPQPASGGRRIEVRELRHGRLDRCDLAEVDEARQRSHGTREERRPRARRAEDENDAVVQPTEPLRERGAAAGRETLGDPELERGGFEQARHAGDFRSFENRFRLTRSTSVVESVSTKGDATQLRRRAMRVSVAFVAAGAVFLVTGLALGAASFTDGAGDANAAPDITSVQVSEAADGLVSVVVGVGNYETLPVDSWFNLWFDEDSNEGTGYDGDETLVRYVSTGALELYEWDGFAMIQRPTSAGMTGTYGAGVLTLTIPKADLGGDSSFGLLAIGARRQQIVVSQFIASDFAPDEGRSKYSGPAAATFTDSGHDEDAAPDITGVRVTDTKAGWIRFVVSTPNYTTLSSESALWVSIDSDNRAATSDIDATPELQIGYLAGQLILERWDPRNGGWVEDTAPDLVRARNSGSAVTIEVRRSAVGRALRFGFSVTTADFDPLGGTVLALDIAPDSGGFYRYTLANKPVLSLAATRLSAAPTQPRAGKPFTVNLAVRRSDTRRGITSGTASCKGTLDGRSLKGTGSVARGAGHCSFAIPSSATGARLRGTITVRVDGKSVAAGFAYDVR